MPGAVLACHLETAADVAGARRLHPFAGVGDIGVARALSTRQLQATGSERLPPHRQCIIALATARWDGERLDIAGGAGDEAALLRAFFAADAGTLITWSDACLPVLHTRALVHRIQAREYWDGGLEHIALGGLLAGAEADSMPPGELAAVLGLPGPLAGDDDHSDGSERAAVRLLLLYLHFQYLRGQLDEAGIAHAGDRIQAALARLDGHWPAFLQAWRGGTSVVS